MLQSFDILGRTVGMYGIATVVGMFLAFLLVYFPNKKKGISFDEALMSGVSALIGLTILGHFLYGITRLPAFFHVLSSHFSEIGSLWNFILLLAETFGGMVFYGGLFGFLIGIYFYCRFTRKDKRLYFNAFAPGLALFHVFGRIGCFFGGCCYGIEYHGPLNVLFPKSAIIGYANSDIADFTRFPVQLLESGLEFLLCIALVILLKKFGNKFSLIKIYLFSYSIIRFSDEFLRGDKIRGFWGPFSTSQWISLIIFVVITGLFIKDKLLKKQEGKGE